MDSLRKIRQPVRESVTKNCNLLEVELAKDPLDKERIEFLFAVLEEKASELETADHNIQEALIQDDVSDEDYSKECEEIDLYKEKLIYYRMKVNSIFKEPTPSVYADAMSGGSSKKKFRLPRIDPPKFGGDLKDWLSFWSLFKKFHEDPEIELEEKFQYLLQSITPGTRARELIESYPPTAENYQKAVDSLHQRFGQEDLLVEVYVRELLRLVLHNATNPKEKIQMTKLYDQMESHIRALDTLGVTSEKCAAMLYPLVESCLPEDVMRAWQRHSQNLGAAGADASKNRLTKVLEFLRSEVDGEERIRLARAGFGLQTKKEKAPKEKEVVEDVPTAAGLFSNESQAPPKLPSCIFCGKKHLSQDCFLAQKWSLAEKKSHVVKKRGCFNCLRCGHISKDCKLQIKCVICSQKHYPMMCPSLPQKKEESNVSSMANPGGTKPTLANFSDSPAVLLKTLMVNVNVGGISRKVRVVIDDGSHRSYILKSIAEELKLSSIGREPIVHALFGGINSEPVNHLRYEVPLGKLDGSYECVLKMLDQEKICSAVPKVPRGPWLGELQQRKIWISDIGSDCPSVDILIGADLAGRLMTGKVVHLKSGLVAVETKLGWTLMGEVPMGKRNDTAMQVVASLMSNDASITNLWSLEAIGIKDPVEVSTRVELELAAKEHFLATVRFNEEGRYEVHLPWIQGHPKLGTNREIAERRLVATTTKLKEAGRYEDYANVFEEWLASGIIEKVPEQEVGDYGHYLPHRAVFKESSSTTKVRPVFDASAHEKGSPSLNDCLEKGPNLIETILGLLIAFREKRLGVLSDIAKAFLQLAIARRDRNFLRFLWWESSSSKMMVVFRHRRVVFGVSSSPFLLAAVLEFHLNNAPYHLKQIAEILRRCFYVDNCVSSVDDEEQLEKFIQESQELLSLAKMDLRGWEFTLPTNAPSFEAIYDVPVLGILWNKKDDTLRCDLRDVNMPDLPVTKRKILSIAHKVFDPLGILCPVTLLPKKLLQSTWESKATWDSELPVEISEKFEKWASDLHLLSEVKIPRWLTESYSDKSTWSIHTFSDASKLAFAACIFLRAETPEGIVVQLVLAKSRVAPLKCVTIPRLELLSCVMGTRLLTTVKECLTLKDAPSYHWTDSTTALSWIQREDQWGTFVGNRVKEIRMSSKVEQWRHVPGAINPADLPSRGCSARNLLESRWWEGPDWLRRPESEWPNSAIISDEEEVSRERRKTVASMLAAESGWSTLCKYFQGLDSYGKIIRRIAWYSRFLQWIVKREVTQGSLTVQELDSAERKLLLAIQLDTFQTLPSFAKSIVYVRDGDGLYRVRSRLTMSDEPKDFKFPILVPASHPVTCMLIREHHLRSSHAGIQTMLATLRERFWVVRARKTIQKVLKECVRCRRFAAPHLEQVTAPLPRDRIRDASVFEVVGVDLAGPLFLKGGCKSWVVIYTCAVYRAVHFELVTSLSTERFLLSFRRFIAKRGRPSIVYSDNGTNFVGAENLFKGVDWRKVEEYSSAIRIQWRFNPPSAAWWGGWWERIVRMLKSHLRRVLGKASLDYEELITVLGDTEEIVNSRPLTYVSEDMESLCPISPALFLKEVRGDGLPEMDVLDHESVNRKWSHRQKLREDLRKRFRSEYLSQLVERSGPNLQNCRAPKVGEIVLIGSDNQKRIDWPMGKILEVLPGKDGNIRVAKVKTAVGELLRPIQRLHPLEISSIVEVNAEVAADPEKTVADKVHAVEESLKKEAPVQVLRPRSGREIRAPIKYAATYASLFSYCD